MVHEATNVSAREALDAGLIDLIAGDQGELLTELDGFRVQGPKATTLETAGYEIEEKDTPLRYEVLQALVDPNIAFLLLLIGLIGITLEILSPGAIIPGVLGSVALVLGLIGTLQLPVAAAGLALLVLAFVLIVAEAHLPTGGLLGVLGIAALVAGGLLLFDDGDGGEAVSPWVAVPVAVVLGGGLIAVGQRVMTARRREVTTGQEELIGSTGRVRVALDPVGQVFVQGALWRARADGDERIEVGGAVRVEAIDGLTLIVGPDPEQRSG
jgi:membrane-bound serine protease (ClpP class)